MGTCGSRRQLSCLVIQGFSSIEQLGQLLHQVLVQLWVLRGAGMPVVENKRHLSPQPQVSSGSYVLTALRTR